MSGDRAVSVSRQLFGLGYALRVFSHPAMLKRSCVVWQKPGLGAGSGTVAFTLDPNTTLTVRTGTVTIVDQIITVHQTSVPPPKPVSITFNGLTANTPVISYAESGFTVTVTSGAWQAVTTYGTPAPFIEFFTPAGISTSGELRITAGGLPFRFSSVDVYSSTTTIPYTITGFRGSSRVYSFSGVVPHTFGAFARVDNPTVEPLLDEVSIALTNSAFPCCLNPMGVDNILLLR